MTISHNWLQQYLPSTLDPIKVAEILTSVGLEVESMETFESIKGGLKGVVAATVMSCEKHPNADKLKVTTVDIGSSEMLQIVCGAPNVAAGQRVWVATVGTVLYINGTDKLEIKKAKIRGVESNGMICAEDELGVGKSHDGILILSNDIPVGTLASTYYELQEADYIYEIGLTPNRVDAMSHLGVVKDICAYINSHETKSIKPIVPATHLPQYTFENPININLPDTQLCKRYAGICIKNIEVKESPQWIQQSLKKIGVKPINNIVDITNFVLHECGQPLHAFDLEKIKGNTIEVKKATQDTTFNTLDNKSVKLHNEDLMIYHQDAPMCIAGVYGGYDSGIQAHTQSIFIESAWFEPVSIRRTSFRHQMRTDAALRFEKGTDIDMIPYALQRACSLILEQNTNAHISNMLDVYPEPMQKRELVIPLEKINSIAGKKYDVETILVILNTLGFECNILQNGELQIQIPYAKHDINSIADITEEIMRIDGLDNIPFTGKISYSIAAHKKNKNYKHDITNLLVAKGFYEIFTNSITSAKYYEGRNDIVMMMNSLSAHLDCMRPSMLETGLESIAYNINRKNTALKFFEMGNVYSIENNTYQQKAVLAIYATGNYRSNYYNEKSRNVDVFYIKGIIDSICKGIQIQYKYHENKIDILYRNQKLGTIMQVDEKLLEKFDIKNIDVCYAEIDEVLLNTAIQNRKIKFQELPKFPIVSRDLSLLVTKQIAYEQIEKSIAQSKTKFLTSWNLFDIFESEKIGIENKSCAINFHFYNPEHTLTEEEINSDIAIIIKSIEDKTGATVRSN